MTASDLPWRTSHTGVRAHRARHAEVGTGRRRGRGCRPRKVRRSRCAFAPWRTRARQTVGGEAWWRNGWALPRTRVSDRAGRQVARQDARHPRRARRARNSDRGPRWRAALRRRSLGMPARSNHRRQGHGSGGAPQGGRRRGGAASESRRERPGLAVVLVGEDPASQVYVRTKARPRPARPAWPRSSTSFDAVTSEAELLRADRASSTGVTTCTASWCSCRCPAHIDTAKVIEAIDPAKDVDGFHPINVGRLAIGAARRWRRARRRAA